MKKRLNTGASSNDQRQTNLRLRRQLAAANQALCEVLHIVDAYSAELTRGNAGQRWKERHAQAIARAKGK